MIGLRTWDLKRRTQDLGLMIKNQREERVKTANGGFQDDRFQDQGLRNNDLGIMTQDLGLRT